MLSYFNAAKAKYAARVRSSRSKRATPLSSATCSLSSRSASRRPGRHLSDGSVYQEYTGWISEKVMFQVVANALAK